MSFKYEIDPKKIEQQSFKQIRELTHLNDLSKQEQQVVMRIVHSVGMPEIAAQVRFSQNACKVGINALNQDATILCDVEMVKQGITKRMLKQQPLCYLNDHRVPDLAKLKGETRSMAALDFWQNDLANSIVLIGNAPTALFRLLEMLQAGVAKPALIIAMPVGFIGAAESKQALWDCHKTLDIECITLLGRQGGSAVTSASLNALLRCINQEWY